ncbi:Prominin-like protein [Eumeta japonica]|uniref:Prominin-like protein n=1 Tax=Eumeta variegata TaxID=151549 RepID=A0A4C1X391_EUMVA|nr:Prominin-like protein [Eumeta japonica]
MSKPPEEFCSATRNMLMESDRNEKIVMLDDLNDWVGVQRIDDSSVTCLMFADDQVILAPLECKLQSHAVVNLATARKQVGSTGKIPHAHTHMKLQLPLLRFVQYVRVYEFLSSYLKGRKLTGDSSGVLSVWAAVTTSFFDLALACYSFMSRVLCRLLWCCCSLCRFGRRRRPFDRKYDGCLKGLLAILLIALLTLFLFGVVCAFTTDEQMEVGARDLPGATRTGVRDVREYLNATQAHVRWLLVNNYQQLEKKLNAMLDSSGIKISMQLGEFSRAASVTTLNQIVQKLDDVRANLHTVKNITARLRFNAEMLNAGLRKVRSRLLETLTTCNQPQCIRLQEKYKIGQLDTDIQYSQMPDVSELLNNVSALLDDNIQSEVAEGQKVFMNIKRSVENSVNTHIPEAQEAISRIGVRLREAADEITRAANDTSEWLKRHGEPVTDRMADVVRDYGPLRRYVGLAAASALLAITCLLALGILCGVCGKRPDVYGANDCCNKGAGSKWLLCSMGLMFTVGAGVALVLLAYYVAGVATQRFVCDPLHEPRDSRLFADLELLVDLEGALYHEHTDPDFNLTYVLLNCHSNHSIYQTLRLERMYDLDKLQSELEAELEMRMRQLQVEYPESARNVVILQDSTRRKLRQLADTGLSDFNFDRILQALETNITSLELTSLAQQLEVTAAELVGREGFSSVTLDLRDAAVMLHAYQRDIVRPMLADTAELNETALRLRDEMRFNRSSLKEAVSNLLHETSSAEHFLSSQGPRLINNLTTEFSASLGASVRAYLHRVVLAVHEDVGRCGPLSAAYNATLSAACHNLLMPANGYWISLAWCVVLFAPVMVVAQRLARLYLHVDPYPGPLVEALPQVNFLSTDVSERSYVDASPPAPPARLHRSMLGLSILLLYRSFAVVYCRFVIDRVRAGRGRVWVAISDVLFVWQRVCSGAERGSCPPPAVA